MDPDRLADRLAAETRENHVLRAKCSQLRSLLEATERDMHEITNQLRDEGRRVPQARQRCAELEAEVARAHARAETLAEAARQAQRDRDALRAAAEAAQKELAAQEARFRALTDARAHDAAAAETALAAARSEAAAAARELAERARQVDALSQTLQARECDGEAHNAQIRALERQLADQEATLTQLARDRADDQARFEQRCAILRLECSKELKSQQLDHERALRAARSVRFNAASERKLSEFVSRLKARSALRASPPVNPPPQDPSDISDGPSAHQDWLASITALLRDTSIDGGAFGGGSLDEASLGQSNVDESFAEFHSPEPQAPEPPKSPIPQEPPTFIMQAKNVLQGDESLMARFSDEIGQLEQDFDKALGMAPAAE